MHPGTNFAPKVFFTSHLAIGDLLIGFPNGDRQSASGAATDRAAAHGSIHD